MKGIPPMTYLKRFVQYVWAISDDKQLYNVSE